MDRHGFPSLGRDQLLVQRDLTPRPFSFLRDFIIMFVFGTFLGKSKLFFGLCIEAQEKKKDIIDMNDMIKEKALRSTADGASFSEIKRYRVGWSCFPSTDPG